MSSGRLLTIDSRAVEHWIGIFRQFFLSENPFADGDRMRAIPKWVEKIHEENEDKEQST